MHADMLNAEKEITVLCSDFCLSKETIVGILDKAHKTIANHTIPRFYNGNKAEWFYDVAQRLFIEEV